MPKFIDITGMRYGDLTVTRRTANKGDKTMWLCRCACGSETKISASNLVGGRQKSCGCAPRHGKHSPVYKHGSSHSTEWTTWKGMKSRCLYPRNISFKYYGGRGIKVCAEWVENFSAFLAHVGPKPSPKHSIDRINNNGNYEPGNVRWATKDEQTANRRKPIQRAA